MVKAYITQWLIKEGKGKYMNKSTKTEIKTFLMNLGHGFTMPMTQCVVSASDVLSKSKAPRTCTLVYQ
jgi:hypothetical protein